MVPHSSLGRSGTLRPPWQGESHALGLIVIAASLMSFTNAPGCSQGQEAGGEWRSSSGCFRWVFSAPPPLPPDSPCSRAKGPQVRAIHQSISRRLMQSWLQTGKTEEERYKCSARVSAPRVGTPPVLHPYIQLQAQVLRYSTCSINRRDRRKGKEVGKKERQKERRKHNDEAKH